MDNHTLVDIRSPETCPAIAIDHILLTHSGWVVDRMQDKQYRLPKLLEDGTTNPFYAEWNSRIMSFLGDHHNQTINGVQYAIAYTTNGDMICLLETDGRRRPFRPTLTPALVHEYHQLFRVIHVEARKGGYDGWFTFNDGKEDRTVACDGVTISEVECRAAAVKITGSCPSAMVSVPNALLEYLVPKRNDRAPSIWYKFNRSRPVTDIPDKPTWNR